MISGNRRIPLVYSNQKAKDPVYMKYVPSQNRVIKFGCLCPLTPVIPQYNVVIRSIGVDPGTTNMSVTISGSTDPITSLPIYVLQFSNTFKNFSSASNFLLGMSTSTTITVTKDSNNYYSFTLLSSTNNGSYWSFNTIVSSFLGGFGPGDTITVTYV